MTSEISTKTIGIILEVLALPIIIVNIVLLRIPNTHLASSTVLLSASIIMLFTGILLLYASTSPQETKNKEENEK